jgi:GGDEF domain-containing protein
MAESDPLHTLHTSVHCYLSTLLAMGECLAEACPPVGGPYRTMLSRLKSRLAFDASAPALEESAAVVADELQDYASKAATYLDSYAAGFRRSMAGVEGVLRLLAQRQEFYGGRLRQFATQLESSQSAGLLTSIESMTYEMQSLAARLCAELKSAEQVVGEAETTDLETGLMNRREMELRIAEQRALGVPYSLIQFRVTSRVPLEALRQMAARLTQQFRHNDRVGRWSEYEFLVLFVGPASVAEVRAVQIVAWLAGRYLLDNGESVEASIESSILDAEAVPA